MAVSDRVKNIHAIANDIAQVGSLPQGIGNQTRNTSNDPKPHPLNAGNAEMDCRFACMKESEFVIANISQSPIQVTPQPVGRRYVCSDLGYPSVSNCGIHDEPASAEREYPVHRPSELFTHLFAECRPQQHTGNDAVLQIPGFPRGKNQGVLERAYRLLVWYASVSLEKRQGDPTFSPGWTQPDCSFERSDRFIEKVLGESGIEGLVPGLPFVQSSQREVVRGIDGFKLDRKTDASPGIGRVNLVCWPTGRVPFGYLNAWA